MKSLTESKFLTDAEREHLVQYLEKHLGERNSIMFRLTLLTGGRCSEVLAVTPADFDHLQHYVTLKGLKGSNDRTLPLPKAFSLEIRDFCTTNDVQRNDKIFRISSRQFRRLWADVTPNPDKSGHSMRHTAGTLLYINCRDINVVRHFLGHRQIQNTLIYLDFVEGPRKLRSAVKGMWNQKILKEAS